MNWNQLGAVLWLRWRVTWNQWSRTGKFNAVVTLIMAVGGLVLGVAGLFAGIFAGAFALSGTSGLELLLVWDGLFGFFLFLWLVGLLTEVQRSELIDLGRMLHLPISLRGIFFINYLASLVTFSIVFFLPGMLGLCLGLSMGKSLLMLWLIPLVLGTMFMVTAWTYCLRGWLIAVMSNQRRRRAILVGLTFAFMLVAQLPNLFFNVLGRPEKIRTPPSRMQPARPPKFAAKPVFVAAHNYIPVLWLSKGAMGLAEDNAAPAIIGALGVWLLGYLGLRRGYHATLRFYQGQETGRALKTKKPAGQTVAVVKPTWLEKTIPWLPEESAVLGLAFLRSMLRAPEIKLALFSNFAIVLVVAASFFSRGLTSIPDKAKPFLATGLVAVSFFGLLQSLFNQFGFDRDGFRALVLLPAKRKHILLAKNVSFLPLAGGAAGLLLLVLGVVIRVPLSALLAAALQLLSAYLMLSLLGNWLSVMFPYRMAVGSLKPTKMPGLTKLMIFVAHTLFPVTIIPIFIPPALGLMLQAYAGWPGGLVNLAVSAMLAAAAAGIYAASLDGFGNLLQRREQRILEVVTTEIE